MKLVLTRVLVFCSRKKIQKSKKHKANFFWLVSLESFSITFLTCCATLSWYFQKNHIARTLSNTESHTISLSLFISPSLSTFWFYLQIWGFAIWHFSQEKTNRILRFTGWVIKPFVSDKTKNFLTHKSIKSKLHPSI